MKHQHRTLQQIAAGGLLVPAPVSGDAGKWLAQAQIRMQDMSTTIQLEPGTLLDIIYDTCVHASLGVVAQAGYRVQVRSGYTRVAIEAACSALGTEMMLLDSLLVLSDWRAQKYDVNFELGEDDLQFAIATAQELLELAVANVQAKAA